MSKDTQIKKGLIKRGAGRTGQTVYKLQDYDDQFETLVDLVRFYGKDGYLEVTSHAFVQKFCLLEIYISHCYPLFPSSQDTLHHRRLCRPRRNHCPASPHCRGNTHLPSFAFIDLSLVFILGRSGVLYSGLGS
jgi:hypothetical protein